MSTKRARLPFATWWAVPRLVVLLLLATAVFAAYPLHEEWTGEPWLSLSARHLTSSGGLKARGLVLVVIGARGCGPCWRMEGAIEESASVRAVANLSLAKVDLAAEANREEVRGWRSSVEEYLLPVHRKQIPQIVLFQDGVIRKAWPDDGSVKTLSASFSGIESFIDENWNTAESEAPGLVMVSREVVYWVEFSRRFRQGVVVERVG